MIKDNTFYCSCRTKRYAVATKSICTSLYLLHLLINSLDQNVLNVMWFILIINNLIWRRKLHTYCGKYVCECNLYVIHAMECIFAYNE